MNHVNLWKKLRNRSQITCNDKNSTFCQNSVANLVFSFHSNYHGMVSYEGFFISLDEQSGLHQMVDTLLWILCFEYNRDKDAVCLPSKNCSFKKLQGKMQNWQNIFDHKGDIFENCSAIHISQACEMISNFQQSFNKSHF